MDMLADEIAGHAKDYDSPWWQMTRSIDDGWLRPGEFAAAVEGSRGIGPSKPAHTKPSERPSLGARNLAICPTHQRGFVVTRDGATEITRDAQAGAGPTMRTSDGTVYLLRFDQPCQHAWRSISGRVTYKHASPRASAGRAPGCWRSSTTAGSARSSPAPGPATACGSGRSSGRAGHPSAARCAPSHHAPASSRSRAAGQNPHALAYLQARDQEPGGLRQGRQAWQEAEAGR